MVMLSAAAIPEYDTRQMSSKLALSRSPGGFYHGIPSQAAARWIRPPMASFSPAQRRAPKTSLPVWRKAAPRPRGRRGCSPRDTWEIEPIVATVDEERCISAQGKKCGLCALACPYGAITVEQGQAGDRHRRPSATAVAAAWPSARTTPSAQDHFTDAQMVAQLDALLADKPEEKIMAFMCHWCSYGGADNAGTSHFEYPASSRGVRVMCSARMDQDFILEAFRRGAGMVLVSGCHPQDCHYITGQRVAAKRFDRMERLLSRMGINPERFRLEWISAAEGDKYARVITEMDAKLKSLDKDALVAETRAALPDHWQTADALEGVAVYGRPVAAEKSRKRCWHDAVERI